MKESIPILWNMTSMDCVIEYLYQKSKLLAEKLEGLYGPPKAINIPWGWALHSESLAQPRKAPAENSQCIGGACYPAEFLLDKGWLESKMCAFLFFKFLVVIPDGYLPGITRIFWKSFSPSSSHQVTPHSNAVALHLHVDKSNDWLQICPLMWKDCVCSI